MDSIALFLPWLDLFWIPLALAVTHPGQRIKAILFIVCCVMMLRFQVELMDQIGFGRGFLGWWDLPLLYRGMAGYGIMTFVYLVMAYFSPRTDKFVFIAASITIFITAFCFTTGLMVL